MLIATYTFETDDPRARFTWNGQEFRAVRIDRDAEDEPWVHAVRLTKRGTDFKRKGWIGLTLTHSLERFPKAGGLDLAAYVREILGMPELTDDLATMTAALEYDAYAAELRAERERHEAWDAPLTFEKAINALRDAELALGEAKHGPTRVAPTRAVVDAGGVVTARIRRARQAAEAGCTGAEVMAILDGADVDADGRPVVERARLLTAEILNG